VEKQMNNEKINEYIHILKVQGIDVTQNKIFWDNQYMSTDLFIANSLNVRIGPSNYPRNRNSKFQLQPRQIFYLNNICAFKYTKLAIFWPLILFSVVSLISLTTGGLLCWESNLGASHISENMVILILFLGILFLTLSVILAVQFFGTKKVAVIRIKGNHFVVKKMSKTEFESINKRLIDSDENKPICFPALQSERTIIREFRDTDAKDVYDILSKPLFHKFLFTSPFKNLDDSYRYIDQAREEYINKRSFKLAICSKYNSKVMGFIGISKHNYTPITCEIIYGIDSAYWHKGYTSEVLIIYLEYLKRQGIETIFGGHDARNVMSGKVLLKAGFERAKEYDYDVIKQDIKYNILSYVLSNKVEEENEE